MKTKISLCLQMEWGDGYIIADNKKKKKKKKKKKRK